jgi:murein DD-endopeptidase MepM/ murein hydrolase activator NlpD
VRAVSCLSSPELRCPAAGGLFRGHEFAVRGRNLQSLSRVVFRAGRGRDDVTARITRATPRYAVAAVPEEARSGRLTLIDRFGTRLAERPLVRIRSAPEPRPVDIAPSSRFFYAGRRKATFAFEVGIAAKVEVALLSEDTGAAVRSWTLEAQPGERAELEWDGRGSRGVERSGRYRFELVGQATGSATAAPEANTRFFFADHLFPIRGRHNLGYTDTNNFGGGRGHKGQDMFARCGTRLAAARGGTVQYAGYHVAAGYYLVVDGADTGADYVYMHLRRPALVATDDRIFTGQELGEVGETGRATGCHLHFELWTAPGWYEGGRAVDPLPALKRWDGWS